MLRRDRGLRRGVCNREDLSIRRSLSLSARSREGRLSNLKLSLISRVIISHSLNFSIGAFSRDNSPQLVLLLVFLSAEEGVVLRSVRNAEDIMWESAGMIGGSAMVVESWGTSGRIAPMELEIHLLLQLVQHPLLRAGEAEAEALRVDRMVRKKSASSEAGWA